MGRPRPPHLHHEFTRHRRPVWYVRVGKGPRIRIRAEYGTDDFKAAYQAALRGEAAPGKQEYPAQTLGWLIARYRESIAWTKLSMATRRQRENIFKHILTTAGKEPYSRIDRKAIVAGRDRRKDTPNAARHFVQTMRGLFNWATEAQHVGADPTIGITVPRPRTEGHHVWTENERETYKQHWPLGTRQRVWYAAVYCTGLRRGDAVRLGRQHIRGNRGKLRAEKTEGRTGEIAYFVVDAEFQEAIAAGPTGDLTLIVGAEGGPLIKESFGNDFRKACNEAGLSHCSAHGLRKARATYAADNGATEAELDAMFGWKRGSGTSAIYTQKVDRERLAMMAAEKMERGGNVYSRTLPSGAGRRSKKRGISSE
jgi:integrase